MSLLKFQVLAKLSCLVDFVVCLFHTLFCNSIYCEIIGREYSDFHVLSQICTSCCLVYLCHALLLILMHCELLACEFSEF